MVMYRDGWAARRGSRDRTVGSRVEGERGVVLGGVVAEKEEAREEGTPEAEIDSGTLRVGKIGG